MQKILHSIDELEAEASSFAAALEARDVATLVTLSGELGAGKTTFTQALARALGITEHVTSPTFVLEKVYELEGQKFTRLVHIDAYRLDGGSALTPLGWEDLIENPENLIVLEWPERVADALPTPTHAILLEVLPENARQITYA